MKNWSSKPCQSGTSSDLVVNALTKLSLRSSKTKLRKFEILKVSGIISNIQWVQDWVYYPWRKCGRFFFFPSYLPFLVSQITINVPSLLTASPLETRKLLMRTVVCFVAGSYFTNLPVSSPSKLAMKNSLSKDFHTKISFSFWHEEGKFYSSSRSHYPSCQFHCTDSTAADPINSSSIPV